jgi:phage-related protein
MPVFNLTASNAAWNLLIGSPCRPLGGVQELRLRDNTGAYRVIYVAVYPEAVYVLHAFQKKTQQTNKRDLDLAEARLDDLK